MKQFTRIKSTFSSARRIPRLGRIRLGKKMQKNRTDGSSVEYPVETNCFMVPPEVEAIYGPTPTELDVLLPSDDAEAVFPQSLAWFGKSKGLKCKGDGETAERLNEQTGAWEPRACPCEHYKSDENPKGECTENAILITILPKVSMGGTYQIRTGSYHSVVDLNSSLDYIRALIGRIAMVPLKLRRVARDTHKGGQKSTHYTMSLVLDATIDGVNQLRNDTTRILSTARLTQIEAPIEENPLHDAVDEVVDEGPQVQDEDIAAVQAALAARQAAPAAPAAPVAPAPPAAPAAPAADELPKWPVHGKHRDKPMDALDHSYLMWFCEKGSSPEGVTLALAELSRRAALLLL